MTLQELEWQGLLALPKEKDWKTDDGTLSKHSGSLTLRRIQMWGYDGGNDTGIRLYCQDDHGDTFEAEIAQFSDCLSRNFMSHFFVEYYNQRLVDIFGKELKLRARDAEYVSIFATEFTRPGLTGMRCAYFASQETEAEAKAKNRLRLPNLAMLRRASRQR